MIDALDSVTARYALNEACVDASIPFVTGGAVGVQGQVFTVLPGSACYSCVFPGLSDEMIPSCGIEGVHPAVLGIVGNIEVSEAVLILTEDRPSLSGRMLHIDIESMTFTHTAVKPVPECSICGDKQTCRKDVQCHNRGIMRARHGQENVCHNPCNEDGPQGRT